MRDFMRVWGPIILIVILGVVVALMFVDPAPPKKVIIAGGAEGGAYAQTAKLYAAMLKTKDIDAEVLTTAGSVDNLAKLKAGQADIAIVQTGLVKDLGSDGVRSLGALFFEPLWVFRRANVQVADLSELKGKKVAIGAEGSGVRVLALMLLKEAGVAESDFTAAPLTGAAAANALKSGEIDVAMVVTGASADWITGLITDPNVQLLSMQRAHALSRRHPYLDEVTLYSGVLDLARGLPATDVSLIAPAAQLAVREKLHPAIQSLLIEAAFTANSGGTILSEPGRFPTPILVDVPLSDEAARYYKSGPSIMRRIFPYAVANFLERAWVLAIPLITLLIPLVRAGPPLYRWRIRRKIYVWYQDLRALEKQGRTATTDVEREEVHTKLAALQAETGHVQVPLGYADSLYSLREHIRFVSDLIDRLSPHDGKVEA